MTTDPDSQAGRATGAGEFAAKEIGSRFDKVVLPPPHVERPRFEPLPVMVPKGDPTHSQPSAGDSFIEVAKRAAADRTPLGDYHKEPQPSAVEMARDDIQELAYAIFVERCPGIVYMENDEPLYENAAKAALNVLSHPTVTTGDEK